jgi:ABC-type transport system involved in multi-copper enzyme maturation permease subunit
MTVTRAAYVLGRAELVAISRSWFVRAWAAIAVLFAFLPIIAASAKEDVVSDVLGGWLVVYFIPSAIVAAIFGAGAITQDIETAADSVLTRAVTRLDYVAAKLVSRTGLVAAIHACSTIPMLYFAQRWGLNDSTTAGLAAASLMTGVMLVFLTAVGVFTGTVLRNLAAAVVIIMVAFAGEGLIFGFLEIRELSPTHVLDDLPQIIRGDSGSWEDLRTMLAFLLASAAAGVGAAFVFQRREF